MAILADGAWVNEMFPFRFSPQGRYLLDVSDESVIAETRLTGAEPWAGLPPALGDAAGRGGGVRRGGG